jgi:hypothetical protein
MTLGWPELMAATKYNELQLQPHVAIGAAAVEASGRC